MKYSHIQGLRRLTHGPSQMPNKLLLLSNQVLTISHFPRFKQHFLLQIPVEQGANIAESL